MTRDYTDQIAECWPTIMQAWQEHSDKHPVIEYDLENKVVGAFPSKDYIDGLSQRTREATRRLFHRLAARGGMMLFIRDPDNRVLQSYTFTRDEIRDDEGGAG